MYNILILQIERAYSMVCENGWAIVVDEDNSRQLITLAHFIHMLRLELSGDHRDISTRTLRWYVQLLHELNDQHKHCCVCVNAEDR
jgi:hypothetical protein